VPAAASFCLDVQYRLLETPWPKRVLRLRACRTVRSACPRSLFAPRLSPLLACQLARTGAVPAAACF